MRHEIGIDDWKLTVRWGTEARTLEPAAALAAGLELMRSARHARQLGVGVCPDYHGLPGPQDIGWVDGICLARELIDVAAELILHLEAPVMLAEPEESTVVRIAN